MQNNIKDHAALSGIFNEDELRVNWHDETLWLVKKKQDGKQSAAIYLSAFSDCA